MKTALVFSGTRCPHWNIAWTIQYSNFSLYYHVVYPPLNYLFSYATREMKEPLWVRKIVPLYSKKESFTSWVKELLWWFCQFFFISYNSESFSACVVPALSHRHWFCNCNVVLISTRNYSGSPATGHVVYNKWEQNLHSRDVDSQTTGMGMYNFCLNGNWLWRLPNWV